MQRSSTSQTVALAALVSFNSTLLRMPRLPSVSIPSPYGSYHSTYFYSSQVHRISVWWTPPRADLRQIHESGQRRCYGGHRGSCRNDTRPDYVTPSKSRPFTVRYCESPLAMSQKLVCSTRSPTCRGTSPVILRHMLRRVGGVGPISIG